MRPDERGGTGPGAATVRPPDSTGENMHLPARGAVGGSAPRDGAFMPTDALIRLLGWRAAVLQGDPFVVERWAWLRRHLRRGPRRTLDAGCGQGAFTFFAGTIGNRAL